MGGFYVVLVDRLLAHRAREDEDRIRDLREGRRETPEEVAEHVLDELRIPVRVEHDLAFVATLQDGIRRARLGALDHGDDLVDLDLGIVARLEDEPGPIPLVVRDHRECGEPRVREQRKFLGEQFAACLHRARTRGHPHGLRADPSTKFYRTLGVRDARASASNR